MKAETSQIPVKDRQTNGLTNVPTRGTEHLWANIRRLKAQMASMELALSTARRDINRIDRKQYREDKESPLLENPDNGQKDSVLFGGL